MRFSGAVVAAIAGVVAATTPATYCAPEDNGICYSFSVPQDAAASGQGDLFMQIRAPTSMSWVGVAQAPEGLMAGSNMFVVYGSQNGSSLTMSPRLGTGHKPPQYNKNVQTTLLDGSGVQNDTMIANIFCRNCNTWQGGSMSLKDESSTWIFGYTPRTPAPTGAIKSNNFSAPLSMHVGYGSFNVDLTKAVSNMPSNVNPFTGQMLTSSNDATKGIKHMDPDVRAHAAMVRLVHGVFYGLAWGFFFPLAAVMMRLRRKANNWLVHAYIQSFSYLLCIVGLGCGIYVANVYENITSAHAIIGFVVTGLAFFMPFMGWMQHKLFVKVKRRTWWGFVHAYLGRALVILGLINIGTGLQLTAPYGGVPVKMGEMSYGVLGGVMGVFYLGTVVVTAVLRRRKAGKVQNTSEERLGGGNSSGTASDSDQPAMLEKELEAGKNVSTRTTEKAL